MPLVEFDLRRFVWQQNPEEYNRGSTASCRPSARFARWLEEELL
jgi:hypothetical protein